MSKFNTIVKEESVVLNHEGVKSFRLTPEMELYTAVVTSSLSNKFYETAEEQIERLSDLIKVCDHKFVAQLAVYTRQEMNLRSIPLFLVVELAKIHSGDSLVSKTVEQVVLRADEIMELLICYQWRNSKTGIKKLSQLSHQIQVGLQQAFNRFDEYQFAKYDRDNLEVKLRDALFLVHPKAKDEAQQALFDKIVSKTLETPYTWETELSALGQQAFETPEAKEAAFKAKWEELIDSGKLGYMALLRNLRNILEGKADSDHVKAVAERLSNPHEVARAKQFPFRYFSAYKELTRVSSINASMMLNALEEAAVASAASLNEFFADSKVMIACDMSGSMNHMLSSSSKMKFYEVGNLLAMLLHNRCKQVVTGIFGDEWKVVNYPNNNVLANADAISKRIGEVGYGTYGGKALEWLISNKMVVDKVMFFTDCQFWDESDFGLYFSGLWKQYKKMAPDAKLYLFDLAGYGQMPLKMIGNDVNLIAGWSDKIFEVFTAIENGGSILERIAEIEL